MLLLWLFSHQVVSDSSLPLAARQASLSLTISWSFAQVHAIALVTPANHLILCCLPLLLPSIFPSIRVFSNELTVCMRWPNSWSFSFSISPSKEYSGLISFKIDWFNLPIVQGTLKSLLQNHSLKASILQCSAFFMVQLSSIHTWLLVHNISTLYTIWIVKHTAGSGTVNSECHRQPGACV